MSRVTFGAGRSQSKQGNAFQEGHSQNKHLASIEIVGGEVLLGGARGGRVQHTKYQNGVLLLEDQNSNKT
jgi:hypothetical protein